MIRWVVHKLELILVIGILPIIVGGISYEVFHSFHGPYIAVADLELIAPTPGQQWESTQVGIDENQKLRQKMQNLKKTITSDRIMHLLAFRLAAHDLKTSTPLSPLHEVRTHFTKAERTRAYHAFRQKISDLEPKLFDTASDSLLIEILDRMQYSPHQLKKLISANRIPGTSMIRLQINAHSPKLATYAVNSLCKLFIRYYTQVERERIESSMEFLVQLKKQKKIDWEEKARIYQTRKEEMRGEKADEETQALLMEIGMLEISRRELQEKIAEIRERIRKRKKISKSQNVTRVVDYDQIDNDHEIKEELRRAISQIKFIQEQLEETQDKLEEKEAMTLAPWENEMEKSHVSYQEVSQELNNLKKEASFTAQSIRQVGNGKPRVPNPFADLMLALLTTVSFGCVWLMFLGRVGYFSIKDNSAHKMPNSGDTSGS